MMSKHAIVSNPVVLLLLPLFAAGCAANVESGEPTALASEALSDSCAPQVPAALAVPDGNRLAFATDAEGVQIYACQAAANGAFSWVFTAPEAQLFNHRGRLVGKHFAGPTWAALDGNSVVGTKLAAYTADATAIPWLLLQGTGHSGNGAFSKVTYIQRLETAGGLAPTTGCDADHVSATARIDYTATYYFYEAKHHGAK